MTAVARENAAKARRAHARRLLLKVFIFCKLASGVGHPEGAQHDVAVSRQLASSDGGWKKAAGEFCFLGDGSGGCSTGCLLVDVPVDTSRLSTPDVYLHGKIRLESMKKNHQHTHTPLGTYALRFQINRDRNTHTEKERERRQVSLN